MRYVLIVIVSAFFCAAAYYSLALSLAPAPIASEYWVREMITVKRSIVQKYKGKRKVIIASGSSTLFGIDTKKMSEELKVPVINLGLHAGLTLKAILNEAEAAAEKGDTVILPLEPGYYCINEPNDWQVRNTIAWNHDLWNEWTIGDRIKAIAVLKPGIILELAQARIRERLRPKSIKDRLADLDDEKVLAKFAAAPEPNSFSHSAYNLDILGNIQKTEYKGLPNSPETKTYICPESRQMLSTYVSKMTSKGIHIYFANAPYLSDGNLNKEIIEENSRQFVDELSKIGPVLDTKSQTIFPKKSVF